MVALREALDGLKKLCVVIETASNALRDKDEELRIVHDTNNRLTNENADLRRRGYEIGDELAKARQDARNAVNDKLAAEAERDSIRAMLTDAQAECKRLREMILNVAVAIEKSGVSDVAKPEATPTPPVEAPQEQPRDPSSGQWRSPTEWHS